MTAPLVISVAPNGARRTQADHPALPLTPAELAEAAAACLDAGAAMIHLHVRDEAGRHVLDPIGYAEAITAIRRRVGDRLVIQITTEAVGRYSAEEQMALVRTVRPEAVSLALAEIVPDTDAEPRAAAFLDRLASNGTQAQYILYTAADVHRFHDLRTRGVIPDAGHGVLFVLGRYAGERGGEPRELVDFLTEHDRSTPWAVCAFGPREHACAVAAAALDGHVRVGFENNLRLRDGRTAPDNAALVAQVREAAATLGRPLATADDLRAGLIGDDSVV